MIFKARSVSNNFDGDVAPFTGAVKDKDGNWILEINTLDDLIKHADECTWGGVLIYPKEEKEEFRVIELYDDYH